MIVEKTILDGVFIINNFLSEDRRGIFVKTFNDQNFRETDIDFEIREVYYSVSHKDVVRGMHFQLPPHEHQKLVYVPKGAIIDVVLDLRKNSRTYKDFISVELSEENRKSIFIPVGLAHGFKSLLDNTITIYNVSTEYNLNLDSGIRFDSFGYDWNIKSPITSDRDSKLKSLLDFSTINPF